MGSIQSIILGGEDPEKEKDSVAPAIQENAKLVRQDTNNTAPVSTTVVSADSNGPSIQAAEPKQADVQPAEQLSKKFESNTDIVDAIYKNRMPTEEELAKERKREKSRQIISAIADGVSAISNLYFAGKGAKNVEQTSMSAANTKRYQDILDRRRKMQDKWDDARLAAYDRDRGFNYQKDRDDASWKRSGEWHDTQVETDNTRYKDSKERNKALDEYNKADRDRNYALSETAQKDSSARGWANHGLQKKAQEDSARLQEERIRATGGKVTRGKRIGFSDGSGNDVGIYENVWRGSMQQVFDTLSKDFRPDKISESMWNIKIAKMTTREKEDFVKQNWTKSPRASAIMKSLSHIDPATMMSDVDDEDQYAKYTTEDDPYAKYAE